MAFHRFGTPILLVESLFFEFDSSNGQFDSAFHEVDSSFCEVVSSTCQFDSSAGLFNSSFYEFDSSLTTSVRRRLSFRRCDVSFRRFDSSTQRGYNSTYITWAVTWFHALLHKVFILNLYSIKVVLNRVNDRFHESGNGIGYLVTRVVLGGGDKALRTPFSSVVG